MPVRVPRWFRRLLIVLAAVFLAMQVVRPDYTNPPVQQAHSLVPKAPSDVRAILDRSCRDCHSNETRWPFYSKIAPMSWLVAGHVHDGRDRFNYSEWTAIDVDDQDKFLGSMCTLSKRGRMPLPSYLLIHRDARMSPGDIATLCAWSEKMRDTLQ
jgi:hypothetical protein